MDNPFGDGEITVVVAGIIIIVASSFLGGLLLGSILF